jgi:hypothetical protein
MGQDPEPASIDFATELDVRARQLRLRWTQIASVAGMSVQNLLRIRKGEIALTDWAASGIDKALQWPDGFTKRIETDPTFRPATESPPADEQVVSGDMTAVQAYNLLGAVLADAGGDGFWEALALIAQKREALHGNTRSA